MTEREKGGVLSIGRNQTKGIFNSENKQKGRGSWNEEMGIEMEIEIDALYSLSSPDALSVLE